MKINKALDQTFSVFLSVITFVVITFIVNIAYDSIFFQKLGVPGFLVLLIIKVFVYAGMYGHIIDLVSGEEIVIRYKRILQNAKKFWFISFTITLVPFILHAVFSFFLKSFDLFSLRFFYVHLHMVALYLVSSWIVWAKYLRAKNLQRDNKVIDFSIIIALLGLYVLDLGVFYSTFFFPLDLFGLQNGIAFFQESICYFQFIFLSVLIINQYPAIRKQFDVSNGRELYLVSPLGGGVFHSFGALFHKRNPAAFVVLKGLTPKDYRIRTFNQYLWRKRYYKKDVLVGITSYTFNSYKAYKIAKDFKACGAKVVMGGPHAGLVPDEALEFCDSVVIGEAESVWKRVISDYENHCLQKKYYGETNDVFCEEVQQEILSSPLEEMKDYIETTRGCKFRCDFCAVPDICGNKIRKKDIKDIVQLIKKLKHKYKKFSFLDNNIYSDPPHARALFKALAPLNIKWGAGCSIDIVKNKDDLRLAKESGCEGVLFGYEIIDESEEKLKGGKYFYVNKYIEYSKEVNKIGIDIRGSFIIGWEGDTWASLWKLLYFSFRIFPQFSIVNILTPLPCSKLYNRLLEEKRLISLNWRNYGYNALVFKHKNLNQFLFGNVFAIYRPIFFLLSCQYGTLYLILIIYIILLPFLTRSITFILS